MKPAPKKKTRAEIQKHVNDLCLRGEIDIPQWRTLTDDLSDTAKYDAEGLIAETENK